MLNNTLHHSKYRSERTQQPALLLRQLLARVNSVRRSLLELESSECLAQIRSLLDTYSCTVRYLRVDCLDIQYGAVDVEGEDLRVTGHLAMDVGSGFKWCADLVFNTVLRSSLNHGQYVIY